MNTFKRFLFLLAAVVYWVVASLGATAWAQEPAPALTLETDHFVVGGGSKFLIFVSYFDAMRAYDRSASSVRSDFQFLKAHYIDGVRIFPNWQYTGDLFNPDGTLNSARLAVLQGIIQIAADEHLIVDVTFARDTVPMDVAPYKGALQAAASALTSFNNVLFDIQNERDKSIAPEQFLSQSDVQDARNRIKAAHAARIVTASNTGASGDDGVGTAAMQLNLALDVAAFHDPRYSDWYDWRTPWVIQSMWYYAPWQIRVYLQEPMAWQDDPSENHHLLALHNAKRYGAAGWTFHTRTGFDLGTQSLVDKLSDGERRFFDRVRDELPTEAWSACNFDVSPTVIDVPNWGANYDIYLGTRWGCSWNVFRQDANAGWVTFTSPTTGAGTTAVYINVAPNPGGYRETKLVIGTVPVLVRQY